MFSNRANAQVVDSPYKVNSDDPTVTGLPKDSRQPPAPIDASIDKWFFISGQPSA